MSSQALAEQQKSLNYHALETKQVLSSLQTRLEGLSEEEVNRRLEEFGPNELKEEKRVTPLSILLDQFKGILVIILILSAIVSGYIDIYFEHEAPLDSYIIMFIVIMNAVIGFIQEYRAEKAVEALKKMVSPKAKVIREGTEKLVPSKDLVPGDILLLEEGTKVPADGRLIETVILKVDEAALTGESAPVTKSADVLQGEVLVADRTNMVFMGTSATYGRGKAVTTATGMSTEFGKIAESLQAVEEEASPLKKRVEQLGRQLGLIAIMFCIIIFVVGVLSGLDLIFMFMTAVSMAVSAVPEGLPAVITVTLAWGVSRMSREKAIVRRLASVDTLGSTTVICSDKTGTLTRNEMTVSKLYANRKIADVTGVGYEPKGSFLRDGKELGALDEGLTSLLRAGCLCNNARLEKDENRWQILGDPTEGALIVAAAKAGMWREDLEKQFPRTAELPFSSVRKRMSTVHATPKGRVLYVKGAPEIILDLCDTIYEHGHVRSLYDEDRRQILDVIQQMAGEGLRLLAMAYNELPDSLQNFEPEQVESELVFIGLAGMIDPPRKEVPEAVQLCKQAGIKSIMITGDHKLTAVAVAKQIGLLNAGDNSNVLTGVELDKVSDEELERIVDETVIYARVSPEHKLRIVTALKRKGHIVAMTGDGVNDAPAIKTADIGVAMGIRGTDVTKEASDMVLEDDNFATIVKAVEGGRHIYENIKKYMRLMLTVNFDEFFEILFVALAGFPLPLLPIHILWVNLISDGLPAVALSMDPKAPDLMQRRPRDPKEGFLRPMWRFLLFVATVDFIIDMVPFLYILTNGYTYWGPWPEDHPLLLVARAENFTSLVLYEVFLAFVCRSETHSIIGQGWKAFTSNKLLFYSTVGSWILQFAILYTPLAGVFHLAPLPPFWLAVTIIDTSTALLIFPQKLLGSKVTKKDLIVFVLFEIGCTMMLLGSYMHTFNAPTFWIGAIIALLSAREIYI